MINASREFKEKLKKGARLVNYADITLSSGDDQVIIRLKLDKPSKYAGLS